MKILVLNCGSSSLKYQLIDMENENVLSKGLVERIGIEGSVLKHEKEGMEGKHIVETPMNDHNVAIKLVLDTLVDKEVGAISSMDEINAVGHRVVHGGEKFVKSVVVTDEVLKELESISDLAPLHNPANIMGIVATRTIMPNTPNVVVFDTAFHQTMKPHAYLYALPYELYENHGVRRYGFHGTSHYFVANRAASMLGKDIKDLKIVTCHLGNGASIAAIQNGESIDTSMGFTPLEGLMMGTRSGDIDPAILPYIMKKEGLSLEEVDTILNKKSGLLGVSGISSDSRDIEDGIKEGNKRAIITNEMYIHKIKKYIGAYIAEMNGIDALVFTAGVGENAVDTRLEVCENMDFFGIELDKELNNVRGKERVISSENSKVKVLLVPTNEELVIARDTLNLVK